MGRIFIVEGDDHGAEALSASIRSAGHEVVGTAVAAFEAYERAARAAPDLAVVDVRSKSGGDAFELASELRRRFGLPTLFVAGTADHAMVRRAGRAEPVGFLVSPFDDRQLRASLEVGLARAQAEARRRGAAERSGLGDRLTVLGALAGGLERALDRPLAPAELRTLLEELGAAGRSPAMRTVPLVRTVERALKGAAQTLGRRAALELMVSVENVWVAADETKLARAIGHVIEAAVEAHAPETRSAVRVVLGRDEQGRATVQVELRDEPGHATRRAIPASQSTGIALAIAEAVIVAHGGSLQHEVGLGYTAARVALPTVPAEEGAATGLRLARDAAVA